MAGQHGSKGRSQRRIASEPVPLQTYAAVTAVAAVLGAALFGCSWQYPFLWDDRAAVLSNADVRPETEVTQLLRNDFWGQPINAPNSHKSFRPLTVLSYRANYAWTGAAPWSYHVVNIVLHATVCAEFAALCLLLSKSWRRSVVAAALFAAHPVHCEAVNTIVGRADLLSAALAVGALLCYVQAAKPKHSRMVGITTFAAFAAYDALLLPAAVWPRRDEAPKLGMARFVKRSARTLLTVPVVARLLGLVLVGCLFMRYRLDIHEGAPVYKWTILENQFAIMPKSLARTLSVLYTHALYLKLLLFPWTLSFDHGFATLQAIESVWDVRNLATVATWAACAVGVALMMARHWRVSLWACVWAVAAFLPASNVFIFVGTEVAERLLYIPSMGFCMLVAQLVPEGAAAQPAPTAPAAVTSAAMAPMPTRTSPPPPPPPPPPPGFEDVAPGTYSRQQASPTPARSPPSSLLAVVTRVRWGVVAVLLAGWALRTMARNPDFASEEMLFESALTATPRSLKALNNRAMQMLNGNSTELRRAAHLLEQAVELYPNYTTAHYNLGVAYRGLDENELALHHLTRATTLPKTSGKAFTYLGQHLLDMHLRGEEQLEGHDESTLELAKRALERAPSDGTSLAVLYHARGTVAYELEAFDAALSEYQTALDVEAQERSSGGIVTAAREETLNQRALCLRALGRYDDAIHEFIS